MEEKGQTKWPFPIDHWELITVLAVCVVCVCACVLCVCCVLSVACVRACVGVIYVNYPSTQR